MRSLAEILRLALNEIRADGATEIVFECNEDGLHIRGLTNGVWHRVVPVTMTMLTKSYGQRGDLHSAVVSFFKSGELTLSALPSGRPITGHVAALKWHTDGTRIRVTWN